MCKDSSNHRITEDAPDKRRIHVPASIWEDTWLGLRKRGRGRKESAAVWAGRRHGECEHVEAVYFLDDYRGAVQLRAYHHVPVEALAAFFKALQGDRRIIIADIHTHPGLWVGLSPLDERNPIEFRVGLPAIVLPSFAKPKPSLWSAGVHLYLGKGKWSTLHTPLKEQLFVFI